MPQPLLERYRRLIESGALQSDSAQAKAAAELDALNRRLKSYRPGKRTCFGFGLSKNDDAPKGLYLYGDVGRGKSLLMDLFFEGAPVALKRRVHFNAFMLETHARIHEWRMLSQDQRTGRREFVRDADDDPIAPVAKRLSQQATLLCFDEFQVFDVADAMILGRLFERLFSFGVVIVATSNTPPERLYEGGLNRPLFLPFIKLITDRLTVIELGGQHDYRAERMKGLDLYITPLGPKADAAMDAAWLKLTATTGGDAITLVVLDRKLLVPRAARGVARFSFAELCESPLGTPDYLALARHFHTVMIDRIPKLKPEQVNEARRFTLLIDTLYDEKVKLVCSAACPPSEIYAQGDESAAFKRAASRLAEMQSTDYLGQKTGVRNLTAIQSA